MLLLVSLFVQSEIRNCEDHASIAFSSMVVEMMVVESISNSECCAAPMSLSVSWT